MNTQFGYSNVIKILKDNGIKAAIYFDRYTLVECIKLLISTNYITGKTTIRIQTMNMQTDDYKDREIKAVQVLCAALNAQDISDKYTRAVIEK